MTAPSTEDHVAEHIPWEQLTINPPRDRRSLWYGIAAAILIGSIALVGFRSISRPTPIPVTPAPSVTAPPPSVVPTSVEVAPAALPPPAEPDLLSEADLRALDPVRIERLIAAHAEWIVLEALTRDPNDSWSDRLSIAGGVEIIEGDASDGVSYVEWVRATLSEEVGPGRWLATVLVRRLVALDGVTYRRLPVELVEVQLLLADDERPSLAAPPELHPMPLLDRDGEVEAMPLESIFPSMDD